MINIDDTALVVIDVQEKLFRFINEKEKLAKNLQTLLKGTSILEIPVILTEQNPAGLGPTIAEIAELVPEVKRIAKFSFSCCDERLFMQELEATNRRKILIAGIETHICVYQTAAEMKNLGYHVQIVADCVSSRTTANNNIGLERLKAEGAVLTSVEMVLFELLKTAKSTKFKEIQKIIK